jgi:hypothetical protein
MDFEVSDTDTQTIRLSQASGQTQVFGGLNFLGMVFEPDSQLYWHIGLHPNVDLTLDINGGLGRNDFDLRGLRLQRLNLDMGLGQTNLQLPSVPESMYEVDVNGGVGELSVTMAEGAALNLSMNGGLGSVILDVPDDAAVRVQVKGGLGATNMWLSSLQAAGGDDTRVWETANYATAERRITIDVEGGLGELTVH